MPDTHILFPPSVSAAFYQVTITVNSDVILVIEITIESTARPEGTSYDDTLAL